MSSLAIEPGGIQRAEAGPGAVDVVQAPAAVPRAIRQLRACADRRCHGDRAPALVVRRKLRQHRDAARRDIFGRRIEQRAVIGERDVVEIAVVVVGIEGAPAAILALQTEQPFARARDGGIVGPVAAVGLARGPSPSRRPRCRRDRDNRRCCIETPSRPAAHSAAPRAQSPFTSSTCSGFSQSRPAFAAALA